MLADTRAPGPPSGTSTGWRAQSEQAVPDATSEKIVKQGGQSRWERTAGRSPMAVTFWQQDGCCYEGITPNGAARKVLFIESKREVPIGAEVALRLAAPQTSSAEGNVWQGTVVWCCPSEDHFANRKGFGVCFTTTGLQVPLPAGTSQSKEAV
jgi:hypothetical protein